ncbi:MAG: leucine-rich repeat domain-containing protein [Promethearchaeota archaeon]
MSQIADQIIQLIVQQTGLSREQILASVQLLQRSLQPHIKEFDNYNDPTFPQLLAQELNVDLGDPTNYLYVELLFDEAPLIVRVIPFTTVNKDKIKATLRAMILECEPLIRDKFKLSENQQITLTDELSFMCGPYAHPEQGQLYVQDGTEFSFRAYESWANFDGEFDHIRVLEDFIDHAELYRTFIDYQIVRTADPTKTFIPYSLLNKVMNFPPDWAAFDPENRFSSLEFPYITLESFRATPDLKSLLINNPRVKEIIGVEALHNSPLLSIISIFQKSISLEVLNFPPFLSLPNLELIHLQFDSKLRNDFFDLSFLYNCPKLRQIEFYINHSPSFKQLLLPPLNHHSHLEEIRIGSHSESVVLSPPWDCPNLKILEICTRLIETLDLTPLSHCPKLQELDLSCNRFVTLNLSPLRHCQKLQKLNLSSNCLTSLDLTPLENHSSLEVINLKRNKLEHIDLSPLENSPRTQINLQNNPITL